MDSEDDLKRPPAPRPYQPVNARLLVPGAALEATHGLLRRAGRRESGLFWYGHRNPNGDGEVKYVVAPRQRMTWGNYNVAPEALAEIVHRLPDDWKPLAQVHSHPGLGVEHSNYDDKMISSRKSLSLVFARYGMLKLPFPAGVGVHEWQNEYWHLLDEKNAGRRVVVIDGTIKTEDLR
jgi:hypothetical protein